MGKKDKKPDSENVLPINKELAKELKKYQVVLYIFYGHVLSNTFSEYFLGNIAYVKNKTVNPDYGLPFFFIITSWMHIGTIVFLGNRIFSFCFFNKNPLYQLLKYILQKPSRFTSTG